MTQTEQILTRLNVEHPIIQAPMVGVSTPQLAAAVSNAGALGSIGLGASTAQQAREMSLRVALGATTGRIVTGVLTQAGRYLVAGLAIGLAAAWWVSRGIASILFEVAPTDLKTYGIVVTVMVTVGFAAALIPARRAARIDPRLVLRSE